MLSSDNGSSLNALYSIASLTALTGVAIVGAGSALTFGIGQAEVGIPVMAVGAAVLALTALLLISAKIVEHCCVPENLLDVSFSA